MPTTIKFRRNCLSLRLKYTVTVMCTFNGDENGIHIERIFKDEQFWNVYVDKAKTFFIT